MAQRDVRQFQVGAGWNVPGGGQALAAPHLKLAACPHPTKPQAAVGWGARAMVSGGEERALSSVSTSCCLTLCSLVLGSQMPSLPEALVSLRGVATRRGISYLEGKLQMHP